MKEECRPSFLRLLFNTLFHSYTPRHADIPVVVSAVDRFDSSYIASTSIHP
jgi:hypothetical protein